MDKDATKFIMWLWNDFETTTEGFGELTCIISAGKFIHSVSDGSVLSDGRASAEWLFWGPAAKSDMILDVEAEDIKREAKILFRGTVLVDGSLEVMSSYRSEVMGAITTAIVLYLLRLFTQTQYISWSTRTCDNDGLVKKVTYLMQQTPTSILSDPDDADLVLPIAHWGSKMG